MDTSPTRETTNIHGHLDRITGLIPKNPWDNDFDPCHDLYYDSQELVIDGEDYYVVGARQLDLAKQIRAADIYGGFTQRQLVKRTKKDFIANGGKINQQSMQEIRIMAEQVVIDANREVEHQMNSMVDLLVSMGESKKDATQEAADWLIYGALTGDSADTALKMASMDGFDIFKYFDAHDAGNVYYDVTNEWC